MNDEYIQTFERVEDLREAVFDLIKNYCIDSSIDEKDIHPTVWNDILDEIKHRIIRPNIRLLKTVNNINNAYDRDKVYVLYEYIYKKICNKYTKIISIQGFTDMTGIDNQTIYDWTAKGLSANGIDFHEKIMKDNEQSVTALMTGDKGIPTKYLAMLNRYHGWNMPGVSREVPKMKELGAAELPKLGLHNAENNGFSSICTND